MCVFSISKGLSSRVLWHVSSRVPSFDASVSHLIQFDNNNMQIELAPNEFSTAISVLSPMCAYSFFHTPAESFGDIYLYLILRN